MSKLDRASLEAFQNQPAGQRKDYINVGMSACGVAAGAAEVYQVFSDEIRTRNLPVALHQCGCAGMCYAEPLVEVKTAGLPSVTYGRVTKEVAIKILDRHVTGGMLVNDAIFSINTGI